MSQNNYMDRTNKENFTNGEEQIAFAKLDSYEKEITELRNMFSQQRRIVEQISDNLEYTKESLNRISDEVTECRNSRLFTIALVLRRLIDQFILGTKESRADFCHWVGHNMKRHFTSKTSRNTGVPLYNFDMLYQVQCDVEELIDATDQVLSLRLGMDSNGMIAKHGRQFFIFASVPYYDIGGGQRFAQIANVLNNMGYRVYYIFGFNSSESKREKMNIPAVRHIHIDKYSVDDFASDIQENDVLILEFPYGRLKPYLDYAKKHGNSTVYEHVDNWDSSLGCLFYEKNDFEDIVRDVDHITVTARILGEKIEEAGRKDYFYCPNAVDSSLFEPTKKYVQPKDLVIGKKTLLYFGSLWGEWFDWELISYVAENCDCTINLIGDYQPVAEKIKKLPKNIYFLGLKKHEELPAYLYYSDIALLPFKNSLIGKYVSPLKIFEYIAMNKPVLATPLDDIMDYPNVVLSEDREVWACAVTEGIKTEDATIFTAENSWYARCNQILDLVGRTKTQQPTVSVIILNRNNMNVIFRCVSSLLTFSGAYNSEIIVVDNNSTDGSYERLVEEYGSKIKVIKNNKNGCSCGRNLGVQHATGEMLLFLDSDQWIIGDHFLDAAFEIFDQNNKIGAVSWGAGWFEENSVGGPIVDYLPNRGIRGPWVMCRTDIAYLATSGLLMKKSLFHEIGGFDEYYDPTCYEDTDLSLKIRHSGYELAYCPYMPIMHLPHQTTQSGSKHHSILMERNGDYFMKKWGEKNHKLLEYYL